MRVVSLRVHWDILLCISLYILFPLYLFLASRKDGNLWIVFIYFSVITLTTAGLGDFVPTSDGAKIACSCFIYFGVATIGLLLGSLLASSLDNETKQDAIDAQVRDCPNCQRLQKTRLRHAMQNATSHSNMNGDTQGGAPKPYEDAAMKSSERFPIGLPIRRAMVALATSQ